MRTLRIGDLMFSLVSWEMKRASARMTIKVRQTFWMMMVCVCILLTLLQENGCQRCHGSACHRRVGLEWGDMRRSFEMRHTLCSESIPREAYP